MLENKEFDKIFQNISFTEMKPSNLINYSTNICQIDQGTIVLVMAHRKKMSRYDKLHNIHGLFELDELSLKGFFFQAVGVILSIFTSQNVTKKYHYEML
jgi:hypothetical protein